jgi:hypothetical protein
LVVVVEYHYTIPDVGHPGHIARERAIPDAASGRLIYRGGGDAVSIVGGVLGACVTVYGTWLAAGVATHNLPLSTARWTLVALLLVAGLTGFFSGSVIWRRASRTRENLALFSGLAGGIGGAVIGSGFAVALTSAYLTSYTTWPQDRVDQLLVLLSYPAFAGLGLFVGGFVGLLVGLVLGGLLRLGTALRRVYTRPMANNPRSV